jgi:hypothetical protein
MVNQAAAAGAMDAVHWLQLLGLGGLAGAVGQGARTVVGFKKLYDAASSAHVSLSELVAGHRIFVSLAIGFIAGALAAIGIIDNLDSITPQQIFALIAAGYAGGDAVEGLISRATGSADAAAGQEVVGTAGATPGPGSDDALG